jgi:hypothetical protein
VVGDLAVILATYSAGKRKAAWSCPLLDGYFMLARLIINYA